ncbi:MAG: NERD domain-containing protein [Candidatus Moranbacteria bacterium]|nr:NERD domain-containing protein [Candidatus Moranbacteria bacterium]
MAQFFGGRSRFIIIMQKMNYIAALTMWVILAYLAYRYIGQLFAFKSAPILSSAVLSIIYFPVAYWALKEKIKYERDGKNYKQGGKGEGAIYYELLKLSDNYLVFQDVKFPTKDFNIDFVVVGPTGIFAIEVKSHKGIIGFNG